MRYLCVRWIHNLPDEPVWLYSEIDEYRWETRKIWLFADGTLERADKDHETGRVWLSDKPIPELAEIAAQSEFELRDLSRDEFEDLWRKATNAA
jgi:hypothetical protein